MKFPILEFYKDEGIINKETYYSEVLSNFKNLALLKKYNIDTALIVFINHNKFPEKIKQDLEEFYLYKSASNEKMVYIYKKKFLLATSPLGCPAAAGLMEELGFMGIRKFFACGTCGLINNTIDSSKFFLVEKAIRDEGLSYKYIKPSLYAYTDKELTEHLSKYLLQNNIQFIKTTTWTTDAVYRETPLTIKKRIKQGAVCVEMECAGWCAVAKKRNYRFAQLLYTSDVSNQNTWKFKTKEERKMLREKVITFMLDCVLNYVNNKLKIGVI